MRAEIRHGELRLRELGSDEAAPPVTVGGKAAESKGAQPRPYFNISSTDIFTPTEAQLIYESPQIYHRVDIRSSLNLEIAHYRQNGCYVQHRREAGRITRRMSSFLIRLLTLIRFAPT
jgi:hypothetical protein